MQSHTPELGPELELAGVEYAERGGRIVRVAVRIDGRVQWLSVDPSGDAARYAAKFGAFIGLCDDAAAGRLDVVVVPEPSALGDTRDEMMESLSRLAEAGALLRVTLAAQRRLK